jgi:flagellar basal-body rod protein FlgF
MDTPGYATLTRQSGLMREMRAIATNMANMSTAGYRGENVIFAEHIRPLPGPGASLSMGHAKARTADAAQGALTQTGGTFDFAIEGDGFFQVETPQGLRLTRAGAFSPNQEGELVAPDGARLLDAGGAPVFVPFEAKAIALAADGTLSADGQPLAEIGLVRPVDPVGLIRTDGVRFRAPSAGLRGGRECRSRRGDRPDDRGPARL